MEIKYCLTPYHFNACMSFLQIASRKDAGESATIHLSGFRKSSKDKDSTFSEDSVTPLERRLYFSTAHFHLRGGCPALAVEVLSKLPNKVMVSQSSC